MSRLVNGVSLNSQALQSVVTVPCLPLAAGVSIAVDLLFSLYPAERPSRLQPIEAFHYESPKQIALAFGVSASLLGIVVKTGSSPRLGHSSGGCVDGL